MEPASEKQETEDAGKKKSGKTRKRSRHIYVRIREQMEFYFSDANLSKDRFMGKLIKEPFIPLETFLTFNKIKSLAESVDILAKALSNSELLELDETKKMVRRKTPIQEITDVDERTLYVEALPANVDHEWVKSMFARFGKVIYVSLPKYAQSRKPKDFGFVEFQKQKSTTKAITFFKSFNGVLLKDEIDPANLASIKSHTSKAETEKELEKAGRKRPLADNQGDLAAKRKKLEGDLLEIAPTTDENSSSSENKTDTEIKDETNEVKIKRRKHKKSSEKRKRQLELVTDAAFYELKILPKMDWKRLRNKYLNLQREKAAEFKRKLIKERQQQQSKENAAVGVGNTREAVQTEAITKKAKNEERKLHKMKLNFYGAGDSEPPKRQKVAAEIKPFMKFEQGLIVEIKFAEPCIEIKSFKQNLRQNATLKYVDVKEGAMEAFLRFETAADATTFVQSNKSVEGKCSVLAGEDESAYWHKIERDRQMKLNKEIKIPSKRGREKVKAALAKHIVFDDEDGE